MNTDIIGMICLLLIFYVLVFFLGYGVASTNVIKLKENEWECTVSNIIDSKAVCSAYKLKEIK